jgi:nucleoside-diphosphate-sugar epimerase
MKKFLVTGGTGFIGSNIVRLLSETFSKNVDESLNRVFFIIFNVVNIILKRNYLSHLHKFGSCVQHSIAEHSEKRTRASFHFSNRHFYLQ